MQRHRRRLELGQPDGRLQPASDAMCLAYWTVGGRDEALCVTAAEIASGDTSATAGQVLAFAKNVFALERERGMVFSPYAQLRVR